MNEMIGNWGGLGWVAAKALLLFLTVVVALRVAERRTLADMSAIDFVLAIGVGSIVGRVPNAHDTSYLDGAVTLISILVAHSVLTRLRFFRVIGNLVDPPSRLLVVNGTVIEREVRRSGLTRNDLFALLRQHKIRTLDEVRYAIFEQRGRFSVLREDATESEIDGNVWPHERTWTSCDGVVTAFRNLD